MLKNIKIYSLILLAIGTFSCSTDNEVEPLFEQDVNTRVQAQLDSYRETLISSEFGWKTQYQPESNIGVFNVYLKFNEDNTVNITSDYDNGDSDLATTYRVGIAQFPELIFESYSVFHKLFEEEDFRLNAEFEFLFNEVSDDIINFSSKTDSGEKSIITFTKATATDQVQIASLQGFDNRISDGYLTDLFFRSMVATNTAGENIFSATFRHDELARSSSILYLNDQNQIINEEHPIILTLDGFDFLEPVLINGSEVSSFVYDETNNHFISTDGGFTTIISHSDSPGLLFYPEVNDFGTEYKGYLYFGTQSGNHLTQTSDAFAELISQSDVPRIDIVFDDFNNGGISYFIFTFLDGSTTFVLFEDQIIENERFIFNFEGSVFGDASKIIDVINILLDPNGFYIERTNESRFASNPSFLLTSAADPNFRISAYGL